MNPREHREQLQGRAHLLRAEGWSQTAIGRELRVSRQTVSRWGIQLAQNGYVEALAQNGLAKSARPFYHIVHGQVEDFRPPEGIRFPSVVADPPWYVSDKGHTRERTARPNRPFTKDFGPWDDFESNGAYLEACNLWILSMHQAAADDAWLLLWLSYRQVSHVLDIAKAAGWAEWSIFTWHKTNPMPMFGNNNFLAAVEMALVLGKGAPRFRFAKRGGRQPHNFFESSQVAGAERIKKHDGGAANLAQKPMALTQAWIDWTTKPGDWVLDAFAGTGTAAVAALKLGRNACIVESDRAAVLQIEARIVAECPTARIWE